MHARAQLRRRRSKRIQVLGPPVKPVQAQGQKRKKQHKHAHLRVCILACVCVCCVYCFAIFLPGVSTWSGSTVVSESRCLHRRSSRSRYLDRDGNKSLIKHTNAQKKTLTHTKNHTHTTSLVKKNTSTRPVLFILKDFKRLNKKLDASTYPIYGFLEQHILNYKMKTQVKLLINMIIKKN
jgi:hypothetical protein